MKLVFMSGLVETDLDETLDYFREELGLDDKTLTFARELAEGTLQLQPELDPIIREFLEKWDFDRLGNVERSILRLAVFELLHRPEIPRKVTLNEAVEMAKDYSTDEAAKFVNGVLDRLAKSRAADKS
ncbi:MAG: transcription antitermination factor NusB [Candidatus Riflebacteria bacterium]|nr:transcription antitermination factor NusB [Candidatus Riflebacteria bacterium]